jgi:hypothetical protein
MTLRSRIADEQPSSLGGWLFADLFLLIMVIGLAGFSISTDKGGPAATTGSAVNRTSSSATLTGLVDAGDAKTTAFFRWGTSSNLNSGDQVTAAKPSPIAEKSVGVDVKADLSQLKPDTTYFFRAVAQNSVGTAEGDVKSFKTDPVEKGACSTAPSFIDTPFTGQYTVSKAKNFLRSDISKWLENKGFLEPKVAVAFVTGWSNNPAGSDGARRAREFYRSTMTSFAPEYFDVNTALRAIQRSENLADYTFEVQLFFVETANQC